MDKIGFASQDAGLAPSASDPLNATKSGKRRDESREMNALAHGHEYAMGENWSGQALSQEAEYVCLRRYPPAPSGEVMIL